MPRFEDASAAKDGPEGLSGFAEPAVSTEPLGHRRASYRLADRAGSEPVTSGVITALSNR